MKRIILEVWKDYWGVPHRLVVSARKWELFIEHQEYNSFREGDWVRSEYCGRVCIPHFKEN